MLVSEGHVAALCSTPARIVKVSPPVHAYSGYHTTPLSIYVPDTYLACI